MYMNELEKTRKRIGVLDAEMARIFVERMKLVEDVAAYKKAPTVRLSR